MQEITPFLLTQLTYTSEQLIFLLFSTDRLCMHCVLIKRHMADIKRCVTFPICSGLHSLTPSLSCSPSAHLQVNSDKIYWQRKLDGTFTQIYSEKKAVGHFISTKAVGSEERNDITHLYKHPEGIIKQNAHRKEITSTPEYGMQTPAKNVLTKALKRYCGHSQAQRRNALLWKRRAVMAPKRRPIPLPRQRTSPWR